MSYQAFQIIIAIIILVGSLFVGFNRRKNRYTIIAMGFVFLFDLLWVVSLLLG